MGIIGSLQWIVYLLLSLVVFGTQLFALVDAIRRPASAFTAEGKLSKPIWLAILGVAAALGFLSIPLGGGINLGFIGIIAVVAAIVYLVDVRPRLQPYGNGRGNGSSGRPGGW
ncbi:DUF2516 family protein [Cellulosimicrobium cellulans]|uniref:DUF2516 family protein n=1 Tax=Cellulosimicrobium cellulans TaxID=1710 RepID=UPI002ADD8228|nr:DUF2516 family protein [Cellulosimicrobium cellulans]